MKRLGVFGFELRFYWAYGVLGMEVCRPRKHSEYRVLQIGMKNRPVSTYWAGAWTQTGEGNE